MKRFAFWGGLLLTVGLGCAQKESAEPLPIEPATELPPSQLPPSEPEPSEPPGEREGPRDSIESRLYPPELVLRHQLAIELTEAQRDSILSATRQAQTDLIELEADLAREEEALGRVLDSDAPDPEQATEAAKRMLALESQVKLAHFNLLIAIKGVLDEHQQKRLDALRAPIP